MSWTLYGYNLMCYDRLYMNVDKWVYATQYAIDEPNRIINIHTTLKGLNKDVYAHSLACITIKYGYAICDEGIYKRSTGYNIDFEHCEHDVTCFLGYRDLFRRIVTFLVEDVNVGKDIDECFVGNIVDICERVHNLLVSQHLIYKIAFYIQRMKHHCEINEKVLKKCRDVRNILNLRITHIIDCEAYTWCKKNVLREVSVLCRQTNIVTTYQIYIPNTKLFDENDRGVRYQIRVIHGLPIERRRIDDNFYLYSEIIDMLRKIFESADLVGYKGGNIERNLLNMLGISCINMEILGCPKYEYLLSKYDVERECCAYHITGKYHCSGHEVKLFSQFLDASLYSTCWYLYKKTPQDLGTREIRIQNYRTAYTYKLNVENGKKSVEKDQSLLWLKGDLSGMRDVLLYDKNTPSYCLIGVDCEQEDVDDDISDDFDEIETHKVFYIISAVWSHYIYIRFENNTWYMYLAEKKFCCRQILTRGDVVVARRENISIQPQYAVSEDYFHVGVGECSTAVHDVLADVGIFVNSMQLYNSVNLYAHPYDKERDVIYALSVHEHIFKFNDDELVSGKFLKLIMKHLLVCQCCNLYVNKLVEMICTSLVKHDTLTDVMNDPDKADKILQGNVPCYTYILDGDFVTMRRDAYNAPLKTLPKNWSCKEKKNVNICKDIIELFFQKHG
ncbi:Hypothetical predicted protein [Paramuricea clavata]|uniref:Uncharacterized protein n=1 Tax=Paramuricea clavata TaxID=317549 RepID=A0A6S7JLG4_PARCT|nr:Hypothetical predicted protein [Paramuricea clavata]